MEHPVGYDNKNLLRAGDRQVCDRPGAADCVDGVGGDEEAEEAEPDEDLVAVRHALVVHPLLLQQLPLHLGVLKVKKKGGRFSWMSVVSCRCSLHPAQWPPSRQPKQQQNLNRN